MRGKVLIVVAALVLGGIAAFTAWGYLGSIQKEAAAGSQMVGVYVATQDIPRGLVASDLVSRGLVEQIQMPRRYVAAGALSSVDGVGDRILGASVSKGEMLTAGRFQSASEAGLAFSVPKGFVAVTIPVDEARGVAGLISPGDHVAILATVEKKSARDAETRVLIPGVQVLAVGQNTADGSEAPEGQTGGVLSSGQGAADSKSTPTTIVTVAVSAADAEKVVFAIESGSIWLALLPGTTSSVPRGVGQTATTVLR